jgi:hypothetical protein
MAVGEGELRATVTRMEERLRSDGDSLMDVYEALRPRFRVDLDDERDELLARSAALMLIQELRDRRAGART